LCNIEEVKKNNGNVVPAINLRKIMETKRERVYEFREKGKESVTSGEGINTYFACLKRVPYIEM